MMISKITMSVREITEHLKIAESSACRAASLGDSPSFIGASAWRFDREEIDSQVDALC